MTKAELLKKLGAECDITKEKVDRVFTRIFEVITDELLKGETFTVTGFGTFAVKRTAARMGRNPRTGAPIKIAAGRKVGFRPGKALKEAVK